MIYMKELSCPSLVQLEHFTFFSTHAMIGERVRETLNAKRLANFIMRIIHHPILGDAQKQKRVLIRVDGVETEAFDGEPVAAALIATGIRIFRTTRKRNEPRRVFCAVGRCTDCAMTVDGQPNVRTCVTPVRDGMEIWTQNGPLA